jgi:hypothetical protein
MVGRLPSARLANHPSTPGAEVGGWREGATGSAGRTESNLHSTTTNSVLDDLLCLAARAAGDEGDVMPLLPARADLEQLRLQAKDLLRAATRGEPGAITRLRAVADRLALSSAQLAVAREHGFTSWAKLKLEVERRAILDSADAARLADLLAALPSSPSSA